MGSTTLPAAGLARVADGTAVTADEVLHLARLHPNLRGIRRLTETLKLMDPGSESPRETWLRLAFIEAGFWPGERREEPAGSRR